MNTALELRARCAALEANLFSQDTGLKILDTWGTNVLEGVLHSSVEIRKELVYGSEVS